MYPEAVINIFKFLVIQCNEENSDYVAELFFVDDMEVPDEISNIIKARILQVRYTKKYCLFIYS